MKKLSLALLLCLTPFAVQAAPLRVVNVSAPAINCIFNPSCTVTVNDTSDNIPMSTGGTGLLQTRTYTGAPGAPAPWANVYEYRVNLTNAVGATAISCIDWMRIDFKEVAILDFNSDTRPDQVFVVTGGGIGTIGLASAIQTGTSIRFNFTSPICEGGGPGRGDSSFFWGLVSKTPPKMVMATLHEAGGATHSIKARAPK